MTIQELEQELLMLDRNERIRLIQVIAQSLALPSQGVDEASTQKMTIVDAIDELRRNMSPEELDPNAEDIWATVRDQTPVN
ncbi:MAG: hypothetical protein B0A82_18100 [Alkalinema sp. CACIAM 70d]|nr:MAG: hypothetical protein B0A82_18100 [Alkalinema sp. CACIAM 70d]